jgi:hypothetical protein
MTTLLGEQSSNRMESNLFSKSRVGALHNLLYQAAFNAAEAALNGRIAKVAGPGV